MSNPLFTTESARELLTKADVFFSEWGQTLNMNDVWAWASADAECVPDDELPQLAELFWRYGFCGILFWVSKRRNNMQSEFHDINRFVDFVRHEEEIREKFPDPSKRAYIKQEYNLGK